MAEREPRRRAGTGGLTPELQCELDALRLFADLVEISVDHVEGKPWDLHSRFWRPMVNALRQAQGVPTRKEIRAAQAEFQGQQAEQPTAAGGPEVEAVAERKEA